MSDIIERLRAEQTSTNYMAAYLAEKARADELRKWLDEQISHTARAIQESAGLLSELAALKERSCAGCKWFENSHDYGGEGFCSHALIPFVRTYETLCCSKWEPKT